MKNRMLATLLALLMIAPAVVSCSESAVNDETDPAQHGSESPDGTQIETMEGYDINGFLLDDLPEDLDFDDQTVSVLYWEDVEMPEFFVEDFNGEHVNDAIHQRNINVEDALNIKYNWIGTPGNQGNRMAYVQKARESVMAADGAYDIFAAYSCTIATCALNSVLTDLTDSQYIDYEKPWWPQNLVEEATMGDSLYFISGDISTNILHMMYGVFCNDALRDEYQLTDPVEYVNEGTWTIDQYNNMATGIYRDLNGNGEKDTEDQFGLALVNWHNDAMYVGSGLKFLEKDPDNILKISDGFYSEKVVNLLDKLVPFQNTDDCYSGDDYEYIFMTERALLSLNRVYYAGRQLRDVDFEYSILPVPKYDEAQEGYKTCLGHPHTLYGVSSDSRAVDAAHAALECAASQAYRLTTPALFENNMKKKYSHDDIDAKMYDIIREGITFELGRFYTKELGAITDSFTAPIINGKNNWASTVEKRRKLLNNFLKEIVLPLEEMQSRD